MHVLSIVTEQLSKDIMMDGQETSTESGTRDNQQGYKSAAADANAVQTDRLAKNISDSAWSQQCQESMSTSIFRTPTEKNVIFCVDTSASMYAVFDSVKRNLIAVLHKKAVECEEFHFNLIEFSNKISQWSDSMVKCSRQTVAVAEQWLNGLSGKSGSNMLDAVLGAFSEPCCDAVFLITGGHPDSPKDTLDKVRLAAQNRALHCYLIKTENEVDGESVNVLQSLAYETYGSLQLVSTTADDKCGDVSVLYSAENSGETIVRTPRGVYFPDTQKYCSLTTSVDSPPLALPHLYYSGIDYYYPLVPSAYHHFYERHYFPHYGWWRYRSASAWSRFTELLSADATAAPIPGAGATLLGRSVLARRNEDSYFYLGSVKSQVFRQTSLSACKQGM